MNLISYNRKLNVLLIKVVWKACTLTATWLIFSTPSKRTKSHQDVPYTETPARTTSVLNTASARRRRLHPVVTCASVRMAIEAGFAKKVRNYHLLQCRFDPLSSPCFYTGVRTSCLEVTGEVSRSGGVVCMCCQISMVASGSIPWARLTFRFINI